MNIHVLDQMWQTANVQHMICFKYIYIYIHITVVSYDIDKLKKYVFILWEDNIHQCYSRFFVV